MPRRSDNGDIQLPYRVDVLQNGFNSYWSMIDLTYTATYAHFVSRDLHEAIVNSSPLKMSTLTLVQAKGSSFDRGLVREAQRKRSVAYTAPPSSPRNQLGSETCTM